jgi:alpha-amylase
MAHAHALILLRLSPAYPCVFYGDLYGILGKKSRPPACGGKLPKMILARKLYAYGGMNEYWDEKECIGILFTLSPCQILASYRCMVVFGLL